MKHPTLPQPKFDGSLTPALIASMPVNMIKCHLAARGACVPTTAEACRQDIEFVYKTESDPNYGPPRILHPELLEPNAVYEPPPDVPDSDDVPTIQKPNKATDWQNMGVGDESDGWVADPVKMGFLAPQTLLDGYIAWYSDIPLNDQLFTFTRNLHKAKICTKGNDQIELNYKDLPDEEGCCLFRAKFPHSMSSENPNSEHHGLLYACVKVQYEITDGGLPSVVRVLDVECTCQSGASKTCWHSAAVLYCAEEMMRPDGALVPESPTAKDNAWYPGKREGPVSQRYDKCKPLSRLPLSNNKRKFDQSPTKTKKGKVRKKRMRKSLDGTGGRFASGYRSCSLGPQHLINRNDERVLAARQALYDAIKEVTPEPCAAEVEWPAKNVDIKHYTVIPITESSYLQGEWEAKVQSSGSCGSGSNSNNNPRRRIKFLLDGVPVRKVRFTLGGAAVPHAALCTFAALPAAP
jgi:hypothetical protein